MSYTRTFTLRPITLALAMLPLQFAQAQSAPAANAEPASSQSAPQPAPAKQLSTIRVTATAAETLKQAPGVSTITGEDIEKRGVVNDLSDIVRRMPGVNLTGNSASGQRGNNRQIDLRGMGPENTLILIDGKPVQSRNSVRYGKSGERDTRGDSNWVPVEDVERIEVIRGPAAARYGSGAAGGVVNIVTKGIGDETHGSMTTYINQPQHSEEGDTRRVGFNLSGPATSTLSYRLYGNYNRTDADDPAINAAHTDATASTAAGREGVKNRDLDALLRWAPVSAQVFDFNYGYSRQGNIYAGDTQTGASATSTSGATGSNPASFLGQETNVMTRNKFAFAHRGDWAIGKSDSWIQYERTFNDRIDEGLVGGTEGNINSDDWHSSRLDAYAFHTELNSPLQLGVRQMLTTGAEWGYQKLDDPASVLNGQAISGVASVADDPLKRQTWNAQHYVAAFAEDNIPLGERLILTPGLRLDRYSSFGNNWSPSLNASWELAPALTLKGGVARVFKAPNLYQTHPNYLIYSSGNGCNKLGAYTVRCYLLGNADLKPEVSTNKELGINWTETGGINAGVTWFRNDYDNKIVSGTELVGIVSVSGQDRYVYKWENATNAVVEGFEGNLLVPLARSLDWSNNFTWMLRNDDQQGQPLSVIPEFTINTSLDWRLTEQLNLMLTGTFYGQQKPRSTLATTGLSTTDDANSKVSPYNTWGVSAGYAFSKHYKGRIGVSNLFDKRLFREGNSYAAGAASYNEPGRAFYASVTASF